MLVIEKHNFSLHNPSWKFTLGPETYETKDTPQRVERIREALAADDRFRFTQARRFPEALLARLAPLPRLHQEDLRSGPQDAARRSTPICSPAREPTLAAQDPPAVGRGCGAPTP